MSEGGYVEGSIESTEGDKVIVKIGKDEKKILKKDQVQQVVTNLLVHYLNKPVSSLHVTSLFGLCYQTFFFLKMQL